MSKEEKVKCVVCKQVVSLEPKNNVYYIFKINGTPFYFHEECWEKVSVSPKTHKGREHPDAVKDLTEWHNSSTQTVINSENNFREVEE